MSVAAGKKRCGNCRHWKVVGVEMAASAKMCRQCHKKGTPMKPKRPLRFMDYEICELAEGDGYFHVRRKVNTRSACGRAPKDMPLNFRQGAGALLTLKDDVACCEQCRETLKQIFGG